MGQSLEGRASGFSWSAESREGILTVRLDGELDLAATMEVGDELMALASRDERVIVIELAGLGFMDSSGLRLLVGFRSAVDRRGGRVLLGHLSVSVKRLFDVSGVTDWFDHIDGSAL